MPKWVSSKMIRRHEPISVASKRGLRVLAQRLVAEKIWIAHQDQLAACRSEMDAETMTGRLERV